MKKPTNKLFHYNLLVLMMALLLLPMGAVAQTLSSMSWANVCSGKMGDSWYGTAEAKSVADIVLAVQKNNGGWMKNDQLHKLSTSEYNTLVSQKSLHSCFDNYATTQEMRFLVKVYKATGETKYLTAFKKALDLIITAGQGKKGGWGQYWPDPDDQYSYQKYITFNDDLMTNMMKMLQDVYEAKGEFANLVDDATRAKCKTAWDAAIQCVLNCQIDDNGTKAIWCAQHDPADFLPTEGRPHEMPSAGPYESSSLLSYLMSLKNPSAELKTSIRAAVEWMKNHKSFENKAVEDYTNSSGVADRRIVTKSGSNLWGRFIQIGGASGEAIYNKLWNKLKARGKKRAHHTTKVEYYEYQLLDASYDASKAYKPIYAIYTDDYPELYYRHLYNYDDTPDATDKYGALVATSLKAANRSKYQYIGSWPEAIINTEYPAWEASLAEYDFAGNLTGEEISKSTYSSSSGSTWNFSDGFVVSSSSGDYANGNNNTVKYASGKDYTITIPAGYAIKKVSFSGYDNYDGTDSYISKLNGTSYSSTKYVFPKKDSNGNATFATHRFDFSSNPIEGSLSFTLGGKQTCLVITLYYESPNSGASGDSTEWKAEATTSVAASSTYSNDANITVVTGDAGTLNNDSQTINGNSFTQGINIRTGATGSTTLSITPKVDGELKVYIRRQWADTYTANDGKDMNLFIGSDKVDGTEVNDHIADEGKYAYCTKTYTLTANTTYTLSASGTTARLFGYTFTPSAQSNPSVDTSYDKTLGNNTYTIAEGDKAVSGTKIKGTDITMTYGDDTWKDAAGESTKPTGYTYYITGSNNPSPSSGSVPTTGCYYKFEPTKAGTLNVAMLVNASKSIYVVENGTSIGYSIDGTNYSAGSSLTAKTGGILSFPVAAGKTYYVYCSGSKLGLFGWTLTDGSSSGSGSSGAGSTVTGTETTPTAKESNTDQVGLCYTVPATYVGGQGNSSKAIKFNLRNNKIEINVNPNYTITGFTFTGNDNYKTTGIRVSSVNIDGGSTDVLGGTKDFPANQTENNFTVSNINATSKITINTTYITAPASGQSADSQLNGTIVFTYKYNVQTLALQSTAKTSSRNGCVTLTFNNPMASGTATLNGKTITADADGTSLKFVYTGLDFGKSYTFAVSSGVLKDEYNQTYNQPVSITVTTDARPTVTKKGFDKIVSNGTELAAAIAAANSRSDKTTRYRIFIKKGAHVLPTNGTTTGGDGKEYPDPRTHLSGANVSFIGEDYATTSFTNITPSATWDNGFGKACPLEGIGAGDVLIIDKTATESYFQGVTIRTSMGDAHGRDIAVNDQSNKTIMKDCRLWGYQDTYVSNNSNGRFYFDGGVLRGRTDYLCGKGDVYYNKVTLQQVGTGGYLAVPSLPTKYGYVFNECYIKKETSDVTYYFGRPWGQGTPTAYFINTTVDAAPLSGAWAEMSNGWPYRFAEYGTKTTSGSSVSTSDRKTTFATSHTNNPVLTAAEATYFSNMARIMGGTDGWDPTLYTEQCAKPTASLSGAKLSWTADNYASSWIVFKDGSYYANPITNSLSLTEEGTYTVRAANDMGGLGEASTAVTYSGTPSSTLAFTAAVQGGSNAAGSTVNQETHYYNNWGANAWAAQAYIGFDVEVPAGQHIASATLKFTSNCGGNYDGRVVDVYLLPKANATAFNTSSMTLSAAIGTKVSTETDNRTASTKTINFNDDALTALNAVADANATSRVIFQLGGAAAGGTLQGYASSSKPSLVVTYADGVAHTHSYGAPEWTWASDGKTASAKIVCAGDASHVLSGNATVTSSVKTAATCTTKGTTKYSASVSLNGTTYTDSKDVQDIAVSAHIYTYTDNGDGTHTKKCSACGSNSTEAHAGECTNCNTYWLVDGTTYTNAETKQYGKVTYTRALQALWNPVCVPFSINVEDYLDKFDVAEIFAFCPYVDTNGDKEVTAEDDDMLIVFKKTSGLTVPGKPYLFRPKESATFTINAADGKIYPANAGSVSCATTKNTYTITGLYSTVTATADNNYYYMGANGLSHRTSGSTSIKPNRWYMTVKSSDNYESGIPIAAKASYGIIVIGENIDESTAVRLAKAASRRVGDDVIYTLQGMKVTGNKLAPGAYIKNGQKIIIK